MTPGLRIVLNDRNRLRADAQAEYQRRLTKIEITRQRLLRAGIAMIALALGLGVILVAL